MKFLDHNPKVVALVGMGPSIVDIFNETLTQECSPNWVDEIWAINMVSNVVQHDVVFWMDDFKQQQNFKPGLFELLRRRGKPVITSHAYPDIVPSSYNYPISEISRMSMPFFGKPYLTNGVAMAIAYALWKGVKVLKIYGCDFTYPNRNFAEEGRACTEAWISLASTKGMEVQLSPSTSLFDTTGDKGIYGYSEQPIIEGPNGTKFQYGQRPDGSGQYQPEDSSGASNGDISTQFTRAAGRARSVDAGAVAPDGDGPPEVPPAPVEGLGEGLRHQGGPGRDETGHPAGLNGGGEGGRVPRHL